MPALSARAFGVEFPEQLGGNLVEETTITKS
jgi:hypothetical protein